MTLRPRLDAAHRWSVVHYCTGRWTAEYRTRLPLTCDRVLALVVHRSHALQQKGGKKPLKASKTSGAGALVLNEEKGGGVIKQDENYAEVALQDSITITGEAKKIPEWMKGQTTQRDTATRMRSSQRAARSIWCGTDRLVLAVVLLCCADGASQKDKDVLCEFVNIYTPDGKTELIRNARVQFVYGRRYGLIGSAHNDTSTRAHTFFTYPCD
jgi:hypothetical protein